MDWRFFAVNLLTGNRLTNKIISPFISILKTIFKIPTTTERRYSLTRFKMYDEIEKFVKIKRLKGKILLVSERHEHSIRKMFPPSTEFTVTVFPETDIANMKIFPNNKFDVVVSDQILEHVPNPFLAVKEIHRVLKSKGFAINTSCSFNPIHDEPDYFRFSPSGFKEIHKIFKKILILNTWGNHEAIGRFAKDGYFSFEVRRSKTDTKLATWSEKKWPWSIWCIAQK